MGPRPGLKRTMRQSRCASAIRLARGVSPLCCCIFAPIDAQADVPDATTDAGTDGFAAPDATAPSQPVPADADGDLWAGADSTPDASPAADVAQSAASDGSVYGWRLTFDDEFDENAIDPCKWQFRYKWGERIVNQEDEAYVSAANADQAFTFDNGILHVVGRKQPGTYAGKTLAYTSGLLVSLHEQMYGYFESRVRMPTGQGLWPAFWLLHTNAYPDVHEIDIMEWVSPTPGTTYMTDHFGTSYDTDDETFQFLAYADDYQTAFHTFGMDWEADHVAWYQDGALVGQTTYPQALQPVSMYVIVNLAIGGNWPGSPPPDQTFPVSFDVDYVRAYQHDGTSGDGTPPFGSAVPLDPAWSEDAGEECPSADAGAPPTDASPSGLDAARNAPDASAPITSSAVASHLSVAGGLRGCALSSEQSARARVAPLIALVGALGVVRRKRRRGD